MVVLEVVGQHVQVAVPETDETQAQAKLTIGEAMEATMKAAGDKPVEYSDAAAIAEAEMRATGQTFIMQGGHAASAQSAAAYNSGIISDRDKIKLRDVVVVIVMHNYFTLFENHALVDLVYEFVNMVLMAGGE